MKETISISNIDKVRLAEMVMFYLNPTEPFVINGKAEVSFKVKSWFAKLFRNEEDDRYDFTEVVKLLTDKIMNGKGEIPYIAQLCGASLGEIVVTNDRPAIIKALYIAHLTDVQPQNVKSDKQLIGQEIKIRQTEKKFPVLYGGSKIFPRDNDENKQLCKDIARLLNQSDAVYVVE